MLPVEAVTPHCNTPFALLLFGRGGVEITYNISKPGQMPAFLNMLVETPAFHQFMGGLSKLESRKAISIQRQLLYVLGCCIEIPWPWYKSQNSQSAQKCLRRVLKVIWVFRPRVPKESLAPSKPCFAPGETA